MIRTTKEWLELLPKPIRVRALSFTKHLDISENTLRGAMLGMFVWEKSKEGAKYWSEVSNAVKDVDTITEEMKVELMRIHNTHYPQK